MRVKQIFASFIFASTIFFSLQSQAACPTGWKCLTNPLYTSQIGAWYEPWWAGANPAPFTMSWPTVSRYQPLINGTGRYYDNGNVPDIKDEFAAVKDAGIDYLILDDTNGIIDDFGNTIKTWIQTNINTMYDVSAHLPVNERVPMAVAIGWQLMDNKPVTLQNSEANYVAAHFAAWTTVYFEWKGVDLLVNYNQYSKGANTYMPNWVDAAEGVRFNTRYAADNINLAANYYSSSSIAGQHGWWGWTQSTVVTHPEAITVSPGADNIHRNATNGCPPLNNCNEHIDRQNGLRYVNQWIGAISANPETIIISSWNEFSDETAIETAWPNRDINDMWVDGNGYPTPDLYVQYTKGYTNLRKGLMANWYYRDQANNQIYKVVSGALIPQTTVPNGKVVIILPAHMLEEIISGVRI